VKENGKSLIITINKYQMKTRFIVIVLLIVSFSCGTNNKPVSDAQKEKIKGEVKEVINTFYKGCEEANFDMVVALDFDSPDFVYINNGKTFSYQESVDTMKLFFSSLLNQKGTIVDEKFVVLDNSTVLYTANTKWLMNFKDGHSVMQDPWAMQNTFKKINGSWKKINSVESGIERIVKASDTPKELNQVELMKQTIGTWKGEFDNKDSCIIAVIKSFGNGGLEGNQKLLFKNKILSESNYVIGYDKKSDKYIGAMINKVNPEINLMGLWFTSKNKYERMLLEFVSNPEQATSKAIYEFKSIDMFTATFINKNKPDKTYTWVRVK
jgi:hypothetical protein